MEQAYLCLSDLLDEDITSYEFFYSLPVAVQQELRRREISTFAELQEQAAHIRRSGLYG